MLKELLYSVAWYRRRLLFCNAFTISAFLATHLWKLTNNSKQGINWDREFGIQMEKKTLSVFKQTACDLPATVPIEFIQCLKIR